MAAAVSNNYSGYDALNVTGRISFAAAIIIRLVPRHRGRVSHTKTGMRYRKTRS